MSSLFFVCRKLFLGKSTKSAATRAALFHSNMHQIVCMGWGFAPDPTGGAYSAPTDSLAVFKGPTFKGREGNPGNGIGNGNKLMGMGGNGNIASHSSTFL